jgi:hypothetical protein
VLLGQHGVDQADQCVPVGEDPDDIGARTGAGVGSSFEGLPVLKGTYARLICIRSCTPLPQGWLHSCPRGNLCY